MAKRDIRKGKLCYRSRAKYSRIIADIMHVENEKERRAKAPKSEDTIYRIDIHTNIQKMLSEGKGKVDILTYLLNKYPNSNLSRYFEQWIDYHIGKKDLKTKYEDNIEIR